MRRRTLLVGWVSAMLSMSLAIVSQAAQPRNEAGRLLKAGEDLYKKGEYPSAAQRFDAALTANSRDPEALLFASLAQIRLDNPQKAAELMGRLQQEAPNPELAQDAGRMRTILLREAAEKAAKQALASERQFTGQRTDPRTVAVATFKNTGSAEFATLGKALAAMLIDNMSALPNVRVLEREQVQALEQEAQLAASGIAETSTAVRVGKLLRAGKVSAGSHADWTASPTHLGLVGLLVDVDAGSTVVEAKSEALASEFFTLVPDVASKFSTALGQPPAQLPLAIRQKVENPQTKSFKAVMAYSQALDAMDRKDGDAATRACKAVQQEDPNWELPKRRCLFVPLVWLSPQGIVAAMEPVAFAMAGTVGSSSLVPAAVGAAVMAGVIGGAYAAFHGGKGGSNNAVAPVPTSPPGVAPPDLTGVGNRNVVAGRTATIDMQCTDPDGTATTISNPTSGPNGTFTQQSGNPATARYQQPTNPNQAGQTFMVSFVCTDSGNPPASTRRDATIRVVSPQEPTTVPEPTSTPKPPPKPTPTVLLCAETGQFCGSPGNDEACCDVAAGARCIEVFVSETPSSECCAPLGGDCDPGGVSNQCCPVMGADVQCSDLSNKCCLPDQAFCSNDSDCCSGSCLEFTAGMAFCFAGGG